MDDAELVRQVVGGDAQAFAGLLERHGPRVLALCRAWVPRSEDARDLAHEAFYRALRDLAALQQPERFAPWLVGIARNVCSDWRRDRENQQVPFSAFGRNGRPGLDPPLERADDRPDDDELERLQAAIDELPDDCREVVRLYYVGEATYQQIAELLDVAIATVNARLTRARRLLRQRLRADAPFPA
jgi:RNA polymerase sigma-70 factor (ECF subfamily)